ncbi:TetR family transcriptional regulator [Paenibacillus mucilaginosus 3016]|uniref:TetR family transcriptional regulator n=2 Tax=Paenibacillus mucilaginosus TaxID=61624 RepID=H6NIV2_9BACL|nr:TetR/AcrR family transcriptional regulator [Paenibacillus mucilaginosus]AFC34002.1 TetR family transcriptional regulator [Paenibacillus mucilaginosus 3016]AFH66330.1 TetR family transcriptional regulator [Paenibacillus mucilaginosus K02]WFA22369.1 TetR/AcrR family transcriptional regulator [Paenibacillus mucilaginosus]
MRKGQMTKEHIIRESAVLFNTKGYTGASLSDIMERCGMRKGGIYNHFENKDEIALAAFDYSFGQIQGLLSEALGSAATSKEKLLAIGQVYIDLIERSSLEGGCPLLNTAVESDDAHPLLKERARQAMTVFIRKLSSILIEGMENEEFNKELSPEEVSSYMIAVIEGGLMLSKLFDDSKYIRSCVRQLTQFIEDQVLSNPVTKS